MAYEGIKTRTQYLTELWSNTRGYSSYQGLDLVYGQVFRARESLLHPVQRALPPCIGSFTKQYGLPCSHMVVQNLSCVIQNGQRCVIETVAFDLAWWDNTWLVRHDMVRFPSLPFMPHVLRQVIIKFDRRNRDPRIIAPRESPQNASIPVSIPVRRPSQEVVYQ